MQAALRPLSLVTFLATLCVSTAACGPSVGPSSAMSLRRVVLYQNGIGYFERAGRIGEERLPLRFGAHEVDDVLSTLTVLDAGDGGQTVVAASVPQRGPEETDDDTVTLELRLPDRRDRDLVMTYAVPTPAWRAAYRAVLPEEPGEGEAVFQIWAFVHNASPEDWNDVSLSLATAAPISYRVDLRTPEFIARPDASGVMSAPTLRGAIVGERSRGGDDDRDGISDVDDLCPGDPEDRDAFEDADGCPDTDNDGDRVADRDDSCPNEPETYNGMEDEDGCPDRGSVVVEDNHIMILDKIYFARGSSAISPASRPVGQGIAAPRIHTPPTRHVEVQGHASDDEARGEALADERASAVRAALVERGVPPFVLTSRGYGAARPEDPRRTAQARERNRRVSFAITDTEDGPTGVAGATSSAPPAPPPPPPRPAPRTVTVDRVARSTAAVSSPVVVEGTTQYEVAARVTIPAHSSSLVTILSERVRGESILLFRPDANAPGSDRHPFRAARIATPRSTTLIPGPVAIYAGGSFAGEGLVEALHEGEVATLPYAIDGATQVVRHDETGSEPARLLAIARGVITVEDRFIRRTRYEIQAGEHAPARLFVRHPRAAGHTPRGLPAGTEETETALLVPVALTAGQASSLVIEETTPTRRQIGITSDLRTPLGPYLEATGPLPPELSARLTTALDRRVALGTLEERAQGLRQRVRDASQRSAELRANLEALGTRVSETRRTLEQRLREASTEVERLSRELGDVQAEIAEARAALSEAILELTLEESAAP